MGKWAGEVFPDLKEKWFGVSGPFFLPSFPLRVPGQKQSFGGPSNCHLLQRLWPGAGELLAYRAVRT